MKTSCGEQGEASYLAVVRILPPWPVLWPKPTWREVSCPTSVNGLVGRHRTDSCLSSCALSLLLSHRTPELASQVFVWVLLQRL